jgi:lysophospholipase L1-like esterase
VTSRRARLALRVLCLTAVVLAVLAADVDPYVLAPAGVMLPLPSRHPLWLAQALVLALAASLPFVASRSARLVPVLSALLAALLAALLLLATPFTRPWLHALGAVLTLGALVAGVLLAARAGPRSPRLENAIVAGLACCAVVLVAEATAASLPASHAVGYTLGSRLWFAKFWSLRNRAGFRDAEREAEPGRRIYVLGDSFVAGVGIADVEQRFTNLLHRRVAPGFRVYNLGRNGAATRDEYARLLEQPAAPDLLILSYYTNDIQDACEAAAGRLPRFEPYANLPSFVRRAVRRSYLLDRLYWRFPQPDLLGYEKALETCYARPETLAAHLADLDRFVEFSRSRDVPLLVVAFPHLLNAAATRRQIGPVIRHLEQRGVPVLDVFPLLETLPVPERVVNRNDAHPSVRLNRLVADALLAALESHGLLARARAR